MGIFKFIPWKSLAGIMPVFFEIIKEARAYAKGGDASDLAELQSRVTRLEREQASFSRFVRFSVVFGVVLFMISAAALVLGIIAMTRV